jgi:hypothetical protein
VETCPDNHSSLELVIGLVQELNRIFFQDVVQMYLLSLNFYEPILHLFFMGGT